VEPTPQDILWLVGFPALLAAVAMLATRPWRRGRDLGGWGAAIAVAGGFAIAFAHEFGVPTFPPTSAQQWLFFATLPLMLIAAAMGFVRSKWFAIVASALVLGITPWLMLRKFTFDPPTVRAAWIMGAAAGMIVWWAGMEVLARRGRGGSLPLLLALVVGVAAIAIINARIASLGRITGAMVVPLVIVSLAGAWSRGASVARGGMVAMAVLLGGLLVCGRLLSPDPLSLGELALLALAPLAAWAGEIPGSGKPDSWKRFAVRAAAVLIVIALPALNAARELQATLDEQTESYSY